MINEKWAVIEMRENWIVIRSVVLIVEQVDEGSALGNIFQVLLDVCGILVRAKVGKDRGICRFVTIEGYRIGKINFSTSVIRVGRWMFARHMVDDASSLVFSAIRAMTATENFAGTCLSRTVEFIEARWSKRVGMPKVVVAGGAFGDGFRGRRLWAGGVHDVVAEKMRSWPGPQAPRHHHMGHINGLHSQACLKSEGIGTHRWNNQQL